MNSQIPNDRSPSRRHEVLSQISRVIAGDTKLEDIVQLVTDAATELSGAQFGAFFYNVLNDEGESYLLYTLSGAPRSAFEKFGMPRNTAVFDHTFRGLGIVRSDDIKEDARYGKMAPHHGMPKGHLPVTSYLAVPVASRTGEIIGGLFLGHENRAVFSQDDEEGVAEIAASAAVAIDNARLLDAAQRLASIVDSSDDAIVSKDLGGIIRSWNRGAERVFGYTAKEIVGKSITVLIPEHLQHEEPEILAKIMRGERIDHFETVRRRKDGSLFHVSVTVSPMRDRSGAIVGASKIARDIDAAKKTQEKQNLLLREMSHRVKNLFAVASGVVALSARSAQSAPELARTVQSRLGALARAHDLTLPPAGSSEPVRSSLTELIRTILSPYDTAAGRINLSGPALECGPATATSFALLLHEFATNSVKYGALSEPSGRISVEWQNSEAFELLWTEAGGPRIEEPTGHKGFGEVLVDSTVRSLGGSIAKEWRQDGLLIRLKLPAQQLSG